MRKHKRNIYLMLSEFSWIIILVLLTMLLYSFREAEKQKVKNEDIQDENAKLRNENEALATDLAEYQYKRDSLSTLLDSLYTRFRSQLLPTCNTAKREFRYVNRNQVFDLQAEKLIRIAEIPLTYSEDVSLVRDNNCIVMAYLYNKNGVLAEDYILVKNKLSRYYRVITKRSKQ